MPNKNLLLPEDVAIHIPDWFETFSKMTTLRPTQDRLAVELDPRDTASSGGIIFSQQTIAKNKPYWGVVRCVGPEVAHCHEGDRVFVPRELGTAVLLDGREVVILRETQVLAKEAHGA